MTVWLNLDTLYQSLEQPSVMKWVCLNEGVQSGGGGGWSPTALARIAFSISVPKL